MILKDYLNDTLILAYNCQIVVPLHPLVTDKEGRRLASLISLC